MYNEDKDLIQNVKDLRFEVGEMIKLFSEVQPSIDEMLELKDQFNELADKTIAVIKEYESSLEQKDKQYNDLLEECRSQFKQVTDDVEALVGLEVDFTDIKERIERCLELSGHMDELIQGPFVLMKDEDSFVPVENRLPYKHYLNVTSKVVIESPTLPSFVKVSPNMGISFTEP